LELIALEVDRDTLADMLRRGKEAGIETRGVADHKFVASIWFRDPNGDVIGLTAKLPSHDEVLDPSTNEARRILDVWKSGIPR